MKRRQYRHRLVVANLDPADRAYAEALGWRAPVYPPVGYEKSLSGPNYFDNLRRNPSYVDPDAPRTDDPNIHVYAKRTERKYTRTGSFIQKDDRPHAVDLTRFLLDVPHVASVDNIEDLAQAPYRVFVDLHSGTVHAVISSNDRDALRWYRRYYSLVPRPITEMTSKAVIKMTERVHNLLCRNGEPIAWLVKEEMLAFIDSRRHVSFNDGEWTLTQTPLVFVGVTNGKPTSIDPHYVRAYQFRYGTYKVSD